MSISRAGTLVFSALLFGPTACGDDGEGGSGPDPGVDMVPDGDAMGSELTGDYDVEYYTAACSGQCAVELPLLGTLSYCDVGDERSENAEFVQDDGHLQIDVNDTPSRYEGGVDADGSFDVVGHATEDGGAVKIDVRVVGSVDGAGAVDGEAHSRVIGTVEDQAVNCRGTFDVTGTRD